MRFSTYIVQCSDESFYTGITSRLEKRIDEHNSESYPKSYCHSRRPVKLVFVRKFRRAMEAISFEKQIKRWSRAKKIALINNDIEKLKELAQCRNESHYKNYIPPKTRSAATVTMSVAETDPTMPVKVRLRSP